MARADERAAAPASRLPTGAPRLIFAAILFAAAALRLTGLTKPLYIDEIVTITVAAQPLSAMAGVMRQIDASPALYPLILHAWLGVSHADAWVRLLPAIFGILAVVAFAGVAARAFGWRAGIAAAAVMAVAPAHVHYAQYVRSYSLFTLLAALHVWLFMIWMDPASRATRARFVLLAGLTAALFYTHYSSVLLLPAEGLFALWRWRRSRGRVIGWAAAIGVALVLFLPAVPLFLHNVAYDRVRNEQRPSPPPLTELVPNLVADLTLGQQAISFGDAGTRRVVLGAAALVFPALWILGAVRGARTRPDMVILLTLVAWLPVVLYVGLGRKLVAVRFFLPYMSGYVAVLGCALASLRPRARAIAGAAVLILCAVPLWHFTTAYAWSYDHRRVAQAIGQRAAPGDLLLFVHPYEQFYYHWYLDDRMPMQGLVFTALADQPGYVIKPPPIEFDRAAARITGAAAMHPRLWIVGQSRRSFASDAQEESRLFAWMDARFDRVADLDALTGGDPVVRLYAVRQAPAGSTR
jgi:uncharacterized membrane protein